MCRFKDAQVFHVCNNCGVLIGCTMANIRQECLSCNREYPFNCIFKNTKTSVDGILFLESIESNSSSLCDVCSVPIYEAFEKGMHMSTII